MGGNKNHIAPAVVIVHSAEAVYNRVKYHEISPYSHRASQHDCIACQVQSGDVLANDVDRLVNGRSKVKAAGYAFDFAALVQEGVVKPQV
jgi:hypothetical protein